MVITYNVIKFGRVFSYDFVFEKHTDHTIKK